MDEPTNAADRADGLKPCPFCGAVKVWRAQGMQPEQCSMCGARGPVYGEAGGERVTWNTRAPEPEGELREALEDAIWTMENVSNSAPGQQAEDLVNAANKARDVLAATHPEAEPTGDLRAARGLPPESGVTGGQRYPVVDYHSDNDDYLGQSSVKIELDPYKMLAMFGYDEQGAPSQWCPKVLVDATIAAGKEAAFQPIAGSCEGEAVSRFFWTNLKMANPRNIYHGKKYLGHSEEAAEICTYHNNAITAATSAAEQALRDLKAETLKLDEETAEAWEQLACTFPAIQSGDYENQIEAAQFIIAEYEKAEQAKAQAEERAQAAEADAAESREILKQETGHLLKRAEKADEEHEKLMLGFELLQANNVKARTERDAARSEVEALNDERGAVQSILGVYVGETFTQTAEKYRREVAQLAAELETEKRRNAVEVCDVCGGKHLESGRQCACMGTGLLAASIRETLYDTEKQLRASEEQREALKAKFQTIDFAKTQATNCGKCGVFKHTPWRDDKTRGEECEGGYGYVCATCFEALCNEERDKLTRELAEAREEIERLKGGAN